MVHGRWLVRDGRPLTLDARRILSKGDEYGRRVRASLAQR
jgi:hypothetical protein